uniref:FimV N-terminal domain-containing protein n=1 Tax=Dechloromonas aromatica (strain RCB) TaxID=159087 RepID=Q47HQ9_DECAR
MNETNHIKFKKRAAALAVASCMSLAPWFAEAAGLGKLTVLSALGQPLRAELDIGATKDEVAGMTARLAPQDAFKQAGVDFATVLLDLRFSVEKRANGQSVVKVSSAKPINEPFLDFLVELNWPAGRLVREYTFLLDPPEIAASQASRPVADARIVETVRGGGAAEDRPVSVKAAASRPAPAPKVAAEPKAAAENSGTRVVRQGETLRKIADESKYDGVSLEQMLVGLFQSNPDAFIGQNVNRLKSGAILNIPEKSAVEAVSPKEAKKIYVAQAADWNAYRQKLAASTAKTPAKDETSGAQASSGKITAKVEEKAVPAEQSKDQLKVARADAAAKGAAAAKAAEAADQIAKDKALKEAQDRMATLEKNVNELQKLLEMKNQKLAELQQPPVKKEEPKAPEVVKPVEPPKPVEIAKPAPAVEEAPKPVEPPKVVEETKPVEPVKPVEPPKPEAPKLEEKPKVVAPPPAPAPVVEESLLDDPLPLVGGGGILALLAGYFLFKRRRTQSSALETTAAPMPSSLGPNSVFRMTGGQSVDTGNTPPQTGEFSQTGPGTIDTDEVDPVAEADVYMAYGRDTQAEEILLEALQKDPQRTAIHAKLLEIYANRHSLKQFETLASELYAQTAGVGPDWEKVAALGVGLDPSNPLYSSSRTSDVSAATMVALPVEELELPEAVPEALSPLVGGVEPLPEIGLADEFERDTLVLPKETDGHEALGEDVSVADELASGSDAMTLDFDLGEQTIAPEVKGVAETSLADVSADLESPISIDSSALDFDLGNDVQEPEIVATLVGDQGVFGDLATGVDLDFNAAEKQLLAPEQSVIPTPDFSPEGTLVMPSATDNEDLDVGLGTWVGADGEPGISTNEEASAGSGGSVDTDSLMSQTIVNPMAGTDTLLSSDILSFGGETDHPQLSSTVVNSGVVDADSLEFDVKLTDSMFLGQPMIPPEFDIGSINLDLAAEPAEPSVSPVEVPAVAEAPLAATATHDAQWEEVNTKLDLAKAYEEMGDLEGARELLQEVVGEGSVDLVEQARTILGRIGG